MYLGHNFEREQDRKVGIHKIWGENGRGENDVNNFHLELSKIKQEELTLMRQRDGEDPGWQWLWGEHTQNIVYEIPKNWQKMYLNKIS